MNHVCLCYLLFLAGTLLNKSIKRIVKTLIADETQLALAEIRAAVIAAEWKWL